WAFIFCPACLTVRAMSSLPRSLPVDVCLGVGHRAAFAQMEVMRMCLCKRCNVCVCVCVCVCVGVMVCVCVCCGWCGCWAGWWGWCVLSWWCGCVVVVGLICVRVCLWFGGGGG